MSASFSPQTLFESALNLIAAIDERSNYTIGRTVTIVRISRALAGILQQPSEDIQRLEWACLYCDLGMLSLPDALIYKPGTLSPQEQNQLRSHVHMSLQMLANHPAPLPIADLVAAHHERYDGTGYPRGLRGYEVPLLANILSAADTLVGMASDRPHRRGFDTAMIAQVIDGERGKQFYPAVVDAIRDLDLATFLIQKHLPPVEAKLVQVEIA